MRWFALSIFALTFPLSAQAQSGRVALVLPDRSELATDAPSVRSVDVLVSGRTAELVRNGFPARLHYKLERWAAGTFVNDVKATTEWEVIVQYDALAKTYRVVRATPQTASVIGEYETIIAADEKLAEPYVAPISPPRKGEKSYYSLSLKWKPCRSAIWTRCSAGCGGSCDPRSAAGETPEPRPARA